MHLARITVELMRAVPMAPLRVESAVVRAGRRIQVASASLWAGDDEVARAVGLRMRAGSVDMPEPPPNPAPALPAAQARPKYAGDWEAFHNEGVEMRFVGGWTADPGPATVWVRLCQPVVPGEEPTGAQRVAAAADFGNGVSALVPFERYLFINADLTVHLARPPVGEWVCLDARTFLSPAHGMGLAESALYDEQGRVGRSVQSLLVDTR
jgi:hypothetical protein